MYIFLYFYSYIKAGCMYKYPARTFDSSILTYIERDVLRTISNDVILVHFQQIENKEFSL